MRIPKDGFWADRNGNVYSHIPIPSPGSCMAFRVWDKHDEYWASSVHPGYGPWTPCPDPSRPEPRPLAECFNWLVANQGRVLTNEHYAYCMFPLSGLQYLKVGAGNGWLPLPGKFAADLDPVWPAEGDW